MEKPYYSHSKPPTFSSKKKPPFTTTNGGAFGGGGGGRGGGGGFFTATSYDDVFGGPPKFASSSSLAPRPEDYSEIFGGFRLSSSSSSSSTMNSRTSSSIPVLDLPPVPDDIGAALFDYSEIFGGAFNCLDFAVSFDQLFNPCHDSFIDDDDDDVDDDFVDAAHGGDGDGEGEGGGGGGGSSDEAWTPVGTESLSDDSDQFASSETRQSFSSIKPHQESESKHFNVSYHKVNPGPSATTTAPNTMHAQLNDMPGYTCVVDEVTLLRENGKEKCAPVPDGTQEITKKTRSHALDNNSVSKAYNSDLRSGSKSQTNPTFASVYDVNLRTEPSNLPPPSKSPLMVADKSGEFNDPSLGLKVSQKSVFEETRDCGLPPFFDMELDGSSYAATSASALADAMEKAQAKMKTAKESRERKDKSQNSGKVQLHTDANDGENLKRPLDESLSGETRMYTSDRGPSKIKYNAKARHTKSTSQNLLNILTVDQPTSVSEKPAGTKKEKRNSLSSDNSLTDEAGQWKEATQYYEFVNNENTRSTPQIHSSNGDAKSTILHQGEEDDDDLELGGEACVAGDNRRRLKAAKAVSRQEYYEKMVKVALEVHDGVKSGNVGPDKKQKHIFKGNPRQQKPKLVYEPEMLEIPFSRTQEMQETLGEAGNRLNNGFENEEEEVQACHNDQVDKKVKGLESVVEEASLVNQGCFKKDDGISIVQDTVEREGHEQKAQDSHGVRIESRIGEVSKQKTNKETREVVYKRSEETSEGVLIGDRVQTASRSEGKDNKNDLQRKKEADKRLKEAFETWKTGESQENNMMRRMQQRDGYENHVDEAVDSQSSWKTLEKRVEQDKCKNDKKLAEQAIGRQMLYEDRDTIVDSKIPEEFKKQDVEKVESEKATEPELHVEDKSFEACEMDNLWCKLEEEVDCRGLDTTLKRSVELEKSATNQEVPEQVVNMERCDEAHDSVLENKNFEEFQGQDRRKNKLEKNAEMAHESFKNCELRETTETSENIDDKADYKGIYGSNVKFELVDEELPLEDRYVEPSNGTKLFKGDEHDINCELKNSQKREDGFKEVTAKKEYDEMGTRTLEGKNKLKEVISGDVIDENQIESDGVKEVFEDSELEGTSSQHSDSLDLNENNSGSATFRTEQTMEKEKKEVSPSTSDPNLANNIDVQGGRKINLAEGQILFDQEDRVRSTFTVFPEEEERFQKRTDPPNMGQTFERKGKITNHNLSCEDNNREKERDLEKERLQKLEEERERLRESEKDRMAVEMTIREARDRAYADARDRAERAALERAADEARQRAMTEARERLEKACAEARERSVADKEARLRAERAAVERATAEARQRAIEKAMAERTTFEGRDRMQRSVSDKYFSEREVIIRQSSFPASNVSSETANNEPAERCKARLERHRRTVERVAKALAEKNMRDLVAQREQAERTRLAETLDADIRRWSSGKEGNLRALLSTLQYILGPDSGWQPIPLTEVITAAAVKKAYRKATLCVHPDKLQQRGATIQQKYTCEKVFDLLKEAWNRFNSEEK